MRATRKVAAANLAVLLAIGALVTPAAAKDRRDGSRDERRGVKELFIETATDLDLSAGTVSMPLLEGKAPDGSTSWYVLTESSDEDDAERRGINPAPKLANALGTAAVQQATRRMDGVVRFTGTPDFSPERVLVPSSPNGFPPAEAKPGAVGDAAYTPLITFGDGIVYNASQVMNETGAHDSLLSFDLASRRVVMDGFFGFYDGKEIFYLKLDASMAELAAIEASTFAPNLNAAPGIGSDDPDTSAREAIIPAVNGPRGVGNPERQGLESALLGEGDPLNIIQEEPGDEDYSPVWDVTPFVWTQAAIDAGRQERLESAGEVRNQFQRGNIVSAPGASSPNESLGGLAAAGFISNCPVVAEVR